MPAYEPQFLALMTDVHQTGQYKPNRTGVGTFAKVGAMLQFDLREGFPAVTGKRLAFKPVVGELMGFFRGCQSAAEFRALGCNVWNQNANETPSWLANPFRKGEDDLGPIYGAQWTAWEDTKIARSPAELQRFEAAGYRLIAQDTSAGIYTVQRHINQLEAALRLLMTDPFNRRIIVNGWNSAVLDQVALPCCHIAYQFVVLPDNTLHSTLWIRSNDLFLGQPFNAASLGLFTHVMARLSGYRAATCSIFITDAHLYENHVEPMQQQLKNSLFEAPRLHISEEVKPLASVDEIPGVFTRLEPRHFELVGYESHGAIKAPMAA